MGKNDFAEIGIPQVCQCVSAVVHVSCVLFLGFRVYQLSCLMLSEIVCPMVFERLGQV